MRGMTFGPYVLMVLVITLFGFVFGLAFIQSGGGIFREYQQCEPPVPRWKFWCQPGEGLDDVTAENSAQALACAVNAAGKGEFSSTTCPGETLQLGFAAAQPDRRCFGEVCVECRRLPVSERKEMQPYQTFDSTTVTVKCREGCDDVDPACTGLPDSDAVKNIRYYAVRDSTMLECSCEQSGGTVAVYGLSRREALSNCLDAKGVGLSSCKEIVLDESKLPSNSFVKFDSVKGKKCPCSLQKQFMLPLEKYSVFGVDGIMAVDPMNSNGGITAEVMARKRCAEDFNDDASLGVEFGDCQKFEGTVYLSTVKYSRPTAPETYYAESGMCTRTFTEEEMECDITDFQLPQDVSKWEDWIPYYGHPKYLLYQNKFPHAEDTWNNRIDWKAYAAMGVLSLLPTGRLLGASWKTAKTFLLKKAGKKALAKVFAKRGLKKFVAEGIYDNTPIFGNAAKDFIMHGDEKLVKASIKKSMSRLGRTGLAKESLKESMKDSIKLRLTKKGLRNVAIGESVVAAADFADMLAESMAKPYEPVGNSLGLAVPYKDTQQYPLVKELDGQPAVVTWKAGVTGSDVQILHFASPCSLSSFTVKNATEQQIMCGLYTKMSNGHSECAEPELTDKKAMQCGVFDESVDEHLGKPFYTKMKDIMAEDSLIFVYNDSAPHTQVMKRIFLPFYPGMAIRNIVYRGKVVTLVNGVRFFPGVTDDSLYDGKGARTAYDVWDAELVQGGATQGLTTVENAGDVVMEAGKEYVIHGYAVQRPLQRDSLIVDVYPASADADSLMDRSGNGYRGLSSNQLRKAMNVEGTEIVVKYLEDAFNGADTFDSDGDRTSVIMKFTPIGDVTAAALQVSGLPFSLDEECSRTPYLNEQTQCFRTVGPVAIGFKCDDNPAFTDSTGNDIPEYHTCRIMDYTIGGALDTNVLAKFTMDEDNVPQTLQFPLDHERAIKRPVISLIDDDPTDNVGRWTTMSASNIADVGSIAGFDFQWGNTIAVSDIVNGKPQHIETTNCRTAGGVIVDLSDLNSKLQDAGGNNYCLRHKSTVEKAFTIGGGVVGVVTLAVTAWNPLGWSAATVWGIMAGAGIGGAAVDFAADWGSQWPG